MRKIVLVTRKGKNSILLVSGPDDARMFIGHHVKLVKHYVAQHFPSWKIAPVDEDVISHFVSYTKEDPANYDLYVYHWPDQEGEQAFPFHSVVTHRFSPTWADIASIVCPATAVVIKRWYYPYWVPVVGGSLVIQKEVKGVLSVIVTHDGWEFIHPGFPNGKYSLPFLFVEQVPGSGSPSLYFE